jgi:hypothetical protein
MGVEDLSPFGLQRVAVHDGLAIDAATWTAAHLYHQTSQRLHARALHGWGIVSGLNVLSTNPPSRSLLVQPGVALDRDGNAITLPRPLRLDIKQAQAATVCVVLRFAEVSLEPDQNGSPGRVAESFQLLECVPPLLPGDLELARVTLVDGRSAVREAADVWNPSQGQIDRRFRRELQPGTVETVTIGHLVLGDGDMSHLHRQGLINVVRELRATAPFAVQYAGDVPVEAAAGLCDLLYVSGAGALRVSARDAAHLLAYVRTGSVLFAEPCVEQETQQQENGRFLADLQHVLADLKFELAEVRPGHSLLQARHIFGLPPQGLGGHAPLLGRGNIILNPNDYGCYWQGGTAAKPLMREPIRSTMEFAVNVAWYAAAAATLRV